MTSSHHVQDSLPELEYSDENQESPLPSASPQLLILPNLPSFSPMRLESTSKFFVNPPPSLSGSPRGTQTYDSNRVPTPSQSHPHQQLSRPLSLPLANSNPDLDASPSNPSHSQVLNSNRNFEVGSVRGLGNAQHLNNSFISSLQPATSILDQDQDDDNVSAFAFNQTFPPAPHSIFGSRKGNSSSLGNLSSFSCLGIACQTKKDFGSDVMQDSLSIPNLNSRNVRDSLRGLQSQAHRDPFEFHTTSPSRDHHPSRSGVGNSLGIIFNPQETSNRDGSLRLRKASLKTKSESVRSDNEPILTLGPGSRSSQSRKRRGSIPLPMRVDLLERFNLGSRDEESEQPDVEFDQPSSDFDHQPQLISHPFNSEARRLENRREFKSDDEISDTVKKATIPLSGLISLDKNFPVDSKTKEQDWKEHLFRPSGSDLLPSPTPPQAIDSASQKNAQAIQKRPLPREVSPFARNSDSQPFDSSDPRSASHHPSSVQPVPKLHTPSKISKGLPSEIKQQKPYFSRMSSSESFNQGATFLPSLWSSPKITADGKEELELEASSQMQESTPRLNINSSHAASSRPEASRQRAAPSSTRSSLLHLSPPFAPQDRRQRPALAHLQSPSKGGARSGLLKSPVRVLSSDSKNTVVTTISSNQGSSFLPSTWASSELLNESLKSNSNSRSSSYNLSKQRSALRKSDSLPSLRSSINLSFSRFGSDAGGNGNGSGIVDTNSSKIGRESKNSRSRNQMVWKERKFEYHEGQDEEEEMDEAESLKEEEELVHQGRKKTSLDELFAQLTLPRRAASLSLTNRESPSLFVDNDRLLNEHEKGRLSENLHLQLPMQSTMKKDVATLPFSEQEILYGSDSQLKLNVVDVDVDSLKARTNVNVPSLAPISHSGRPSTSPLGSNRNQKWKNRSDLHQAGRTSSPIPFSTPFDTKFFNEKKSDPLEEARVYRLPENLALESNEFDAHQRTDDAFLADDSGIVSAENHSTGYWMAENRDHDSGSDEITARKADQIDWVRRNQIDSEVQQQGDQEVMEDFNEDESENESEVEVISLGVAF